jgi:hypothetical protein
MLDTTRGVRYNAVMKEKTQHPRPEIVGGFKIVYPIFRDDLAEAVLTPAKERVRFAIPKSPANKRLRDDVVSGVSKISRRFQRRGRVL